MTQLVRLIEFLLPIYVGLTKAQDLNCTDNEVKGFHCGEDCIPTCQGKPGYCQCQEPSLIWDYCYELCLCKKGYIRDQPGGKCVPKEECPKVVRCPENEEFSERKSDCEPSCQNRTNQSSEYDFGCVCKKGYIREGPGGRCVPESCKDVRICKKNEIWSRCASCPTYCNASEIYLCPLFLICNPGCNCVPGYIRKSRSDPTCIPISKCPCRDNEVYLECGTACPETCSSQQNTTISCTKQCVRGCFCKEGYILDDYKGKCIEKSECPKK